LRLRKPLLLTGAPGSGKSTVARVIASELQLEPLLVWNVTSRSTLTDAQYTYDALGRLHATQVPGGDAAVERFVTLGPLGTALATQDRPRAVLINEIDNSDLYLPGDLIQILELGEFEIPPLLRDGRPAGEDAAHVPHRVRGADQCYYDVDGGVVRRKHPPILVLTSNGEQAFPRAFLRRCVQFEMRTPPEPVLLEIVEAHLGTATQEQRAIIADFADRLAGGKSLAVDQLLSLVYLVTGKAAPGSQERSLVENIVLEELSEQ
jgi:MoxR-like ATPase